MKSRRKVELAIADLKRFATGANRDPAGFSAFHVIWNLRPFLDQLACDPVNLRELLNAAQLLASGSGPGQGRAQEDLFEDLRYIAETCREKLEEQPHPIQDLPQELSENAQPFWHALQALAQFAVWCLDFRKPRDSFGGSRRVAAFEILSQAGLFMDLPEAVRRALELEKSPRDDGPAASDFLSTYHEAHGTPEIAKAAPKVLQLKVVLRDIHPLIWRRFLVPNDFTLGDLHFVVYRVMGWDDSHMHLFKFGRVRYAGTETVDECGPPFRHEDSVKLAALIKRKGRIFTYDYDFGDGWEHEIKVEDVLPFDPRLRLPVCLAGERACPPEDCGGVRGYRLVLEALQSPHNPKLREFRDWIGEFDPEKFDLQQVNAKLQPNE